MPSTFPGRPDEHYIKPQTKNKNYIQAVTKISSGARNRGNGIRANPTIFGFPLINVSVTSNSIDLPYNYTYNGYSGQVNGFTALSQLGIQNTNNLTDHLGYSSMMSLVVGTWLRI
jgi:hypothetical protein